MSGPRHLLFAVCDHYEPLWAGSGGQPDFAAAAAGGPKADVETGLRRVEKWHRDYPKLADRFRDADGQPPLHSFFFPGEEYHPQFFDLLDDLVRRGYGEVELHLHHGDDTEASLRKKLEDSVGLLAGRGHFARAQDGSPRYAFIHGNWALANGRPDGQHCGVDSELPLLYDTGCYADFTFPSCPDVTQPNIVNEIYWPTGDIAQKRAYEQGQRARVGDYPRDRLLMITGPLGFGYHSKQKRPRVEYGALTAHDPGTRDRVRSWARSNIHIAGRPEWVFVKVYTHGAPDKQGESLLGAGGESLHQALGEYNDGRDWVLHYVTAREMYNIARAAIAGKSGNPGDYRDFELPPPPIRQDAQRVADTGVDSPPTS